jgi:hypothetical protein
MFLQHLRVDKRRQHDPDAIGRFSLENDLHAASVRRAATNTQRSPSHGEESPRDLLS